MAIEKNEYVERVMIILNADGTFQAASKQSRVVVTEGDDVLSDKQGAAEPLSEGDLVDVLPDTQSLMASVKVLEDCIIVKEQEIDALASVKEQEIEALNGEKKALGDKIESLKTVLDES